MNHPAAATVQGNVSPGAVEVLEAAAAFVADEVPCVSVRGMDDDELLAAAAAAERLGRGADALRISFAAEIAERSRSNLGTERLSAKRGCRSDVELIERSP